MMPVGDQQLLVGHQLLDARRIGDLPDAMPGAVFIRDDRDRRGFRRLVEQRVNRAGRVRIQHKELPEMGVRVPQQLQTVFLRSRERLLVAMHHAGRILLQSAERDEALPHQAFARIRNGELLEVRVDPGLGVARQNARRDPVVQIRRGARVNVVGVGIPGLALAEDDSYEIVRARREILLLHLRRNLVIRLRDDMRQRTGFICVTEGVKRKYAGQDSE